MAIDFGNTLLKLNPMSAIDLSGAGGNAAQMGMERQRLQLARQQFEETKKQNAEENRLREMATNATLTRERLESEREAQKAQALARAKQQELSQAAYGEAFKAADVNDQAGVDMAAQRLREYGGFAENMGTDPEGRPSWRLGTDAQAEQQRQAQLAQQAAPQPLAPGQGDESLDSSLNRLNALGYDQSTRGVLDMGANMDSRRAQLQPALDAVVSAQPEGDLRESARRVGQGASLLGLSPKSGIDQFNTLNSTPNATVRGELDAKREIASDERKAQLDLAKETRAADAARPKAEQELIRSGYNATDKSFKTQKLSQRITSMELADEVKRLVTSTNPADHGKAVNFMMVLGAQSGPQSEGDAKRITGEEDLSAPEKIEAWINRQVEGGKWESIKKSMVDFAARVREREKGTLFSWMDAQIGHADNADNPLTAKGHTNFLQELPKFLLDEYAAAHGDEDAEPPAAEPGQPQATPISSPIDIEPEPEVPAASPRAPESVLDDDVRGALKAAPAEEDFPGVVSSAAEGAGLNAGYVSAVMGGESGGKQRAKNPNSSARGIIQMIDSTARGYTNPRTGKPFKDSAEFADLPREEQVPVMVELFRRAGLDEDSEPEDYALAVAAPKYLGERGDFVVYPKGSKGHAINKPWWPADGGDITVDSITAHYFGKNAGAEEPKGKPRDAELDTLLE